MSRRLASRPARAAVILAAALLLAIPAAAQDGVAPTSGRGAEVYAEWCAQCHNDNGDGRGIAAPFLLPPPRDFTSGKYKLRSTPDGTVPLDADIERSIRQGLPGTAMPAFPELSDAEVDALVEHLKSFSPDFEDPEAHGEPIPIPSPPPVTDELIEQGRELVVGNCLTCHGELGRGDGGTAPLQRDQWYGDYIRVADLTMPWNFRAGGTREDIYKTLVTGLTGTPMASYQGALTEQELWAIATYIVADAGGTEAPYTNLLRAVGTDEDFEVLDGDLAAGRELFADAPESMFPVIGQIMEPGREFYPSAQAVRARAVYDDDEIAVMVSWHDMRAETSGHNGPDLPAPAWAEEHEVSGPGDVADDVSGGASPWGDAEVVDETGGAVGEDLTEAGGFWGEEVADEPAADGTESAGDFWDEAGDTAATPAADADGPDREFSDAVAVQIPVTRPTGVAKPYFLLGDAQNPVDLWFTDLASGEGTAWVGRGSAALTPAEGEPPEVLAGYDRGEWTVIFKARRRGERFAEGEFLPIAFSVWDGFNRERGNKRGLTQWQHLYLEPRERPSPIGPMLRAGLGVLALELLIIFWANRRKRRSLAEPTEETRDRPGFDPARSQA